MAVLKIRNTANDAWFNIGTGPSTTIMDADGDTYITCEASADEDMIRFDTDGSERMVITSSGKVGIGEVSPDRFIHAKSSDPIMLKLESSSPNGVVLEFSDGTTNFGYVGSEKAITGTGDKDRLILSAANSKNLLLRVPPGQTIETDIGTTLVHAISADGEITTPTQPAFAAAGLTAAMDNMAILTNHTVKFDEAHGKDVGNDYNSSTWQFTAPVDGWYHFSFAILLTGWDQTPGQTYFHLITTNNYFGYLVNNLFFETDSFYAWANLSSMGWMDANDVAYIQYYKTAGAGSEDINDNVSYTYFNGRLLG